MSSDSLIGDLPRWKIWLEAARPKTLWAAFSPVIIGTTLAIGDGKVHWLSAVITLIAALLIQIGTNFANDYFDYKHGADTHERLGPLRVTQARLISEAQMKRTFILTFLLAFGLGLYLVYRGGVPILIIGLLSILFGILYTGGPYPLGYHGWGDVFVLLFFGPVAVGGTYYVQALTINWQVLVVGLAPGFISTALLTVNNLRDVETDARSGKKTLAVRFGKNFARAEYLLCMLFAAIIPIIVAQQTAPRPLVYVTLLILPLVFPAIRIIFAHQPGKIYNQALAQTGKSLFFYSLLFAFGWLL